MSEIPSRLITYCTNIHPAETWRATFDALRRYVPAIKSAVSPNAPFPIGLRLSNRAATELTAAENDTFKAWLDEEGCFVPTINGFPYGSFHGKIVKKRVYHPDWRSRDRADYTIRLADHLAAWLPSGVRGSISTVPLGFRSVLGRVHDPVPEMRGQLEYVLSRLARIYKNQGKDIILALEPEPGCLLETTFDVCRFFERLDLPPDLQRHLGVCFDSCHHAVEFEDPVDSLERLTAAGIPLAKVQVSAALKAKELQALLLTPFDEPFYLHQVVVLDRHGRLSRFDDLSDAIFRHASSEGEEWRCHFHVPIFQSGFGRLETTSSFLTELLPRIPQDVLLEVETYSWDVLPAELRTRPVTDSIVREMRWLKERLHA